MRRLNDHSDQSASAPVRWVLPLIGMMAWLLCLAGCTINTPVETTPVATTQSNLHVDVVLTTNKFTTEVFSAHAGKLPVASSFNNLQSNEQYVQEVASIFMGKGNLPKHSAVLDLEMYAEKHLVDALNGKPLPSNMTLIGVDMALAAKGRPWQAYADGGWVDLDHLLVRKVNEETIFSLDLGKDIPDSDAYHWQPLTPENFDKLYEKLDAKYGIEKAFGGQGAATQPTTLPTTQPSPSTGPSPSTQPAMGKSPSPSTMPSPSTKISPATTYPAPAGDR